MVQMYVDLQRRHVVCRLTACSQNSLRSRTFQPNRSLSAASLPPSATSKRKLKAFQFIDGAPSDRDNKENIDQLAVLEKAADDKAADPITAHVLQPPLLKIPESP